MKNQTTLTDVQANFVGDAYMEHGAKLVKQISRKFASDKRYNATDIESYLNEQFTAVALKYDPSKMKNLGAYLNRVLTQRAINYTNSKEAGVQKIDVPFSALSGTDAEGDDKPSFESTKLTDWSNVGDDVTRNDHVSETIKLLFSKATDLQKAIMSVYLNADGKLSYTEVGKAVGKHHETVKRELAKLAKLADFDLTVFETYQIATAKNRAE